MPFVLRALHGPHSRGAENKINTAELNQDGDLVSNKNKTIKIIKWMALRTVGFQDEYPCYLFLSQENSGTETA